MRAPALPLSNRAFPQWPAHDSVPLVDSTPVRRESSVVASIHRARQRLEGRFDHVMGIASAQQIEMEIHPGLVGQRLHEIVYQHGLKPAHPFLLDRDVVGEIRASADIDHRRAQRFVERHRRAAEAP